MWNLLRDLGTRLLRDLTGSSRERQELLAAQIRLNERETENAPSSVLRLWRSFLGWVLALLFCWEVPVRLLLLPLLAPDLLDDLPRFFRQENFPLALQLIQPAIVDGISQGEQVCSLRRIGDRVRRPCAARRSLIAFGKEHIIEDDV